MQHWQRTLGVAAIAQVFSIVGFSFVVPFLPLYVQQLGIHGTAAVTLWSALLSGGSAVFMAFAAPIWGALADRHGRKIMVARASFSAAILIALMGFVSNVYQLLLLRMLQGMFTGTVSASQALVSSQSPRDRLGFTMGVMTTAIFVGTSVGPLLGGVAADAVGFRRSFFVAGFVLFLAAVIVTLFIQEEKPRHDAAGPRPKLLAGMGQALRMPSLLPMIGAVFTVQFGVTVVQPILPQFIQYLQGAAGHAATATGLVLAGTGLAGAISSVSLGFFSDRIGYKRLLVTAAIAAAILSVPQFFVTATWQLFVLRVLLGLVMGAMMPSASALIATLVPAERRGTAYGLSGSATSIGLAAGPLTAAAVVQVANMRAVFLTAAVLLAAIAVWVGSMVHVPEEKPELPPLSPSMELPETTTPESTPARSESETEAYPLAD